MTNAEYRSSPRGPAVAQVTGKPVRVSAFLFRPEDFVTLPGVAFPVALIFVHHPGKGGKGCRGNGVTRTQGTVNGGNLAGNGGKLKPSTSKW
jgi:hypothetical protein